MYQVYTRQCLCDLEKCLFIVYAECFENPDKLILSRGKCRKRILIYEIDFVKYFAVFFETMPINERIFAVQPNNTRLIYFEIMQSIVFVC